MFPRKHDATPVPSQRHVGCWIEDAGAVLTKRASSHDILFLSGGLLRFQLSSARRERRNVCIARSLSASASQRTSKSTLPSARIRRRSATLPSGGFSHSRRSGHSIDGRSQRTRSPCAASCGSWSSQAIRAPNDKVACGIGGTISLPSWLYPGFSKVAADAAGRRDAMIAGGECPASASLRASRLYLEIAACSSRDRSKLAGPVPERLTVDTLSSRVSYRGLTQLPNDFVVIATNIVPLANKPHDHRGAFRGDDSRLCPTPPRFNLHLVALLELADIHLWLLSLGGL